MERPEGGGAVRLPDVHRPQAHTQVGAEVVTDLEESLAYCAYGGQT